MTPSIPELSESEKHTVGEVLVVTAMRWESDKTVKMDLKQWGKWAYHSDHLISQVIMNK